MCLAKEVQHEAAVLPGSGGRVRTVEDYFLLILGAQRPLATLAAPQKPFNSLGWMLGSISVQATTTQLHQGHTKNRHMTPWTRPLIPPPPPNTTAEAAAASSPSSLLLLYYFSSPLHFL